MTLGLHVLGRAIDLWWHVTHDEFETATDQITAHWLVWLSVIAMAAVAGAGLRLGITIRPLLAVLFANLYYAGVATWHFVEHYNHRDPATPHLLLAIGEILIGVTAVWGALAAGRLARYAQPRSAEAAS